MSFSRPTLAVLFAVGGVSFCAAQPELAAGASVGGYGLGSVFVGDAADTWDGGVGLGLTASTSVSRLFDLRGDLSGRWFDGSGDTQLLARPEPHWGGRVGEDSESLRLLAFTASLVHEFDAWSRGGAWTPYAGAGAGFYDGVASYRDTRRELLDESGADDSSRDAATFSPGLHVLAGVRMERASGMFITLETKLHAIDTPEQWSTCADFALGVGASLPRP